MTLVIFNLLYQPDRRIDICNNDVDDDDDDDKVGAKVLLYSGASAAPATSLTAAAIKVHLEF
jgi:hypothetical protein